MTMRHAAFCDLCSDLVMPHDEDIREPVIIRDSAFLVSIVFHNDITDNHDRHFCRMHLKEVWQAFKAVMDERFGVEEDQS